MRPIKLLLVDDRLVALRRASVVLERAGYEVISRSSAIGTGAIMLREQPEIVVVKRELPGLGGNELLQMLRQHPALAGVYVVLFSEQPTEGPGEPALVGVPVLRVKEPEDLARMITALASEGAPVPPQSLAPPPATNEAQPTILLVDDDRALLHSYGRLLSGTFVVEYARSGAEALVRLRAATPPLIIVSDVRMPEWSGVELYYQAIGVNPSYRDRFVFITGWPLSVPPHPCLGAFRAPILQKPVTVQRLVEAIRDRLPGATSAGSQA